MPEADALRRLPRWVELPDLELYMDQVLGLVARSLEPFPGFDEKGLTAAMVNNYVKLGALPPPVKKRYRREHVARLIILCLMKSSFPISAIARLLEGVQTRHSPEEVYSIFCERFEAAVAETAAAPDEAGDSPYAAVLRAALRAQAERALALRMFGAAFPEREAEKN